MRATILGVTLLLIGTAALPVATAGVKTAKLSCSYEVGNIDLLQLSDDGDDFGIDYPTDDGAWNLGGCNHRLPRHPDIFGLSVAWPSGQDPIWIDVKVVDDTFGTDIGGYICNDYDNTHTCDDAVDGEKMIFFCGGDSRIEPEVDTDGDGVDDFGDHIFTIVHGPISQAVFCDPTANPVGGTTGGVTDSNGGIHYTYGFHG